MERKAQSIAPWRMSIAPMMDGDDSVAISVFCVMSCAAYVHVSIALRRTLSRQWRATKFQ